MCIELHVSVDWVSFCLEGVLPHHLFSFSLRILHRFKCLFFRPGEGTVCEGSYSNCRSTTGAILHTQLTGINPIGAMLLPSVKSLMFPDEICVKTWRWRGPIVCCMYKTTTPKPLLPLILNSHLLLHAHARAGTRPHSIYAWYGPIASPGPTMAVKHSLHSRHHRVGPVHGFPPLWFDGTSPSFSSA